MQGKHLGPKSLEEAKKILEETVNLARKLYGRKWAEAIDNLEELYDGDPWAVLNHLRREADKRGLQK